MNYKMILIIVETNDYICMLKRDYEYKTATDT